MPTTRLSKKYKIWKRSYALSAVRSYLLRGNNSFILVHRLTARALLYSHIISYAYYLLLWAFLIHSDAHHLLYHICFLVLTLFLFCIRLALGRIVSLMSKNASVEQAYQLLNISRMAKIANNFIYLYIYIFILFLHRCAE